MDGFLIEPYFEASRLPGAPDTSMYDSVGTTKLLPEYRMTYLPVANGFQAGETVAVSRFDARDGPSVVSSFDTHFRYAGAFEGWSYNYMGHYGSWMGFVSNADMHASIACWRDSSWNKNPQQICEIIVGGRGILRGNALLRLKAGGKRFRLRSICNPGHFDLSDVIYRPIRNGGVLETARNASLSIDGAEPVALPDGGACHPDPDGALFKRISNARTVRTTFKPRFDTRTFTREGSPSILKPAIELAARLQMLTFDARAAAAIETEQHTLWHRAQPFSLFDALSQRPEWTGTLRCLKRSTPAANATSDIEQALDTACRDWFADLSSHAAGLGADTVMGARPPESVPGGAERAARARQLIVSAASATPPMPATQSFAPSEKAASVIRRPGRTGVALRFHDSSSHDLQEYGYVLTGSTASALLPAMSPTTFARLNYTVRSIRIECNTMAKHRCIIDIPTDDGKGSYLVHTNGPWHGAKLCVRYEGADFATWKAKQYDFADEEFFFKPNGCLASNDESALRMIAWGTGPSLLPPGEKLSNPRGVNRMEFDFALALAGYLADRLPDHK